MAHETERLLNELSQLQEEYAKLQDHLSDIELKYQSELTCRINNEEDNDKFATKLQIVVSDLFNKQSYSDVLILMEDGRELSGHKLVLSARSVEWGAVEMEAFDCIDLADIRYDVAYAMMKWVYTDEIDVNGEEAFLMQLLQVATRFRVDALHMRCQKALISCININNCNTFYQLSEKNSSLLLKDYCLEFFSQLLVDTGVTGKDQVVRMGTSPAAVVQPSKSSSNKLSQLKPGGKPFKCDVCSKTFSLECFLERHQKMHGGDNLFKCEACGKTLISKQFLERHKRSHVEKNKYPCPFCGKLFDRKCRVKLHMRVHSGEKPYQCHICGKGFAVKGHLPEHLRVHSGEKPHKCDVCGKTFNHRYGLHIHKKLHSNERRYQCDFCGKAFLTRTRLNIHKSTHSNEKPHKCSVCGKSYGTSSHLKRHTKTSH